MNPLEFVTGGVAIINNLIKLHKLDKWVKLLFGFAFSWFVAFTGELGHRLITGLPLLVSVGWGLIAGNTILCTLFFLNDQTKGIMIATFKTEKLTNPEVESFEKKG